MALLDGKAAVVTGGSSGTDQVIARGFAEHGAEAVVSEVREPPEGGGKTDLRTARNRKRHRVRLRRVRRDASVGPDRRGRRRRSGRRTRHCGQQRGDLAHPRLLRRDRPGVPATRGHQPRGAYFGSQIAAERLVENHGGDTTVDTRSIAGPFGNAELATYSASKDGLTMLTDSLAHKPGKDVVPVNAVPPGSAQTMIGGEPADPGAAATEAEQFTHMVPLGRYGRPEEIAGPSTFLASDRAGYVTGESLVVDRDWTSRR